MTDRTFQRFETEVSARPTPRVPFGKYRGRPIDNCPKDYLEWLLTRLDRDDWLAAEIMATLAKWNAQRKDTDKPKDASYHQAKPCRKGGKRR